MKAMNKKFQKSRILAVLMSVALIIALIPITVHAESEYTTDGATRFVFSDSEISVSEGSYDGYKIDGTSLTINGEGTYIVSGSCENGSIKIKKGTTGVTLVLDGITLKSADTAPIACNKSSEVKIVAAEGTVNALEDGESNNDDNYPDNENAENAVIKCKDGSNVTICGTGTLSVTANGKNGIKSGMTTDEEGDASLTIRDVTLNITAPVNDAINAEQLLDIESGKLTISAADDAIHCDLELNIGSFEAAGPEINITACYEGLEAATLNIFSGNIKITASDDCLNAANSGLTDYSFSMNIYGGTINAYTSSGDGFDSNGSMTISGGTISVWTANTADNQPLDADGTITITGDTVLAAGGSSGMGMNISAQQPYVAFGGMSGMGGMNGNPGGMGGFGSMQPGEFDRANNSDQNSQNVSNVSFTSQTDSQTPDLSNGQFSDNSDRRPQPGNGQIPDGSSGGMQPGGNGGIPNGSASGSSVKITKGSTLAIKDESGNTIYSAEAVCDAGFVFFSSADLTSGSSYTLYSNDEEAVSSSAQIGTSSGNQQPGNSGNPGENPGGNTPEGGFDSGDQPGFPGNGTRPDQPNGGFDNSEATSGATSETADSANGSPSSDQSESTSEDGAPKTGDSSHIIILSAVLCISAIAIPTLVYFKKKTEK